MVFFASRALLQANGLPTLWFYIFTSRDCHSARERECVCGWCDELNREIASDILEETVLKDRLSSLASC